MDIFVLIVAAIFFFAVATLFRSNEAIDRVKGVEQEIGVLEDEVKAMEDQPKQVIQESSFAAPPVHFEEVHAPFPDQTTVHKE